MDYSYNNYSIYAITNDLKYEMIGNLNSNHSKSSSFVITVLLTMDIDDLFMIYTELPNHRTSEVEPS